MVFNSSGLSHGGPTHNKRKNLFMTTKKSQWQRIVLLAAGISTSMVSTAWGQNLYQTHSDGSIWEYTGKPCSGGSCPGWIELDNNPKMNMIAAGGGTLFEMHTDGSIWWYIGPPCNGGSCPGWAEIDNNPNASAIGVGGQAILYELHTDLSLWQFNGLLCSGSYCPGWTELSGAQTGQDPYGFFFGANASMLIMENAEPEYLYRFGGAYNSWGQIDSGVKYVAVGATTLYDWLWSGEIRQYNASPTKPGWVTIDDNPTTNRIVAGGGLYQQRRDSSTNPQTFSLWQYTGTPCNGSVCPGWVKIDNHPTSAVPVAGSNTVYQMRTPSPGQVSIMQYTGTPCLGTVCPGWIELDDNPNTTSIVAGPMTFQLGFIF
jgi:hypothetical protein